MFCVQSGGVDQTSYDCNAVDALIVVSRVELSQLSPFYLDVASAVAIGGPILMLMAVAFVLRMIRKYLETENDKSEG
jgi:hypothetical protein